MDVSGNALDAQGRAAAEPPALPLIVVDSSTLRKLEAKFTHFRDRSAGIPETEADILKHPYSFLDFLTQKHGMTLVFPRAVIREMLIRRDGLGQDVYAEWTGHNSYHLGINTRQEKLTPDAALFAAYLDAHQKQVLPDGAMGLRIYHNTETMLKQECPHPHGGIIVVDSGSEGPLTPEGVLLLPPVGSQAGDLAIGKLVKAARHYAPIGYKNPRFAVLADDFGLRCSVNMPSAENASFAVSLRGLIKALSSGPKALRPTRHAFVRLFDYDTDVKGRELKPEFAWEKQSAEKWLRFLKAQRRNAEEEQAKDIPAAEPEPLMAAPSTVIEAAAIETAPPKLVPLAERAVMGPPLAKHLRKEKPLPKPHSGGKLSAAEIERRQKALLAQQEKQ